MDMNLAVLVIILAVFVALLASPIFLSRRKAVEEKDLTPLFQESCVVRRDLGSGSSLGRNMILWRVSLYPEFMVLALFSRALIPYREIDRVEMKSFQDDNEVWIRRNGDPTGELITIISKHAVKMIEVFTSLGVRYDRSRAGWDQRGRLFGFEVWTDRLSRVALRRSPKV